MLFISFSPSSFPPFPSYDFYDHVAFGPLALLSHALIYSPTTFKILAHGTKLKLTWLDSNGVSGVTNTVGGVVGAVGRGLGETVNGVTGNAGLSSFYFSSLFRSSSPASLLSTTCRIFLKYLKRRETE